MTPDLPQTLTVKCQMSKVKVMAWKRSLNYCSLLLIQPLNLMAMSEFWSETGK